MMDKRTNDCEVLETHANEKLLETSATDSLGVDRPPETETVDTTEAYREQLEELLSDGFEQAQAQLIIDLRRDDERRFDELVKNFMSMGDDRKEASSRAASFLDLADTKRLSLIKASGVSTLSDYGRLLANS